MQSPKVVWILDNALDVETQRISKALSKANIDCISIDYDVRIEKDDLANWLKKYNNESDICLVVYGTIEFVKRMDRLSWYTPTTWYDNNSFKCSYYYNIIGENLLNGYDHMYLPFNEVRHMFDTIQKFARGERVFIRPDVGLKTLPAMSYMVSQRSLFMDVWDSNEQIYTGDETSLCLISQHRDNIESEWRFFVVDNKVVTGSKYMQDDRVCIEALDLDIDYDFEAMRYAQWVVDSKLKHKFIDTYVIDVCMLDNGDMYIVELNCANCSGIYESDVDLLVRAMTDKALKECMDI